MTIERCIECDNPTNDSRYVGDDGPFCETCFEWKEMVAEHKAVVEKLAAEVERLKAHTWEQERAAVVAWLRLEPSYQNRPWAVITADIERGEHWPEGETSRYCVSAEAYEKEAIRLKETIKTASADGANALIASFGNVDPKARVCELEAEVARLKEAVKRLPEFTWKAERYREVCDVLKRPQGEDVVGMVESIKKEWEQLRSGTTISVEQAQKASQSGGRAAATHAVRVCATWLRENGWHNSVRDTAIEMERVVMEDINNAYGTPGMCVPSNCLAI